MQLNAGDNTDKFLDWFENRLPNSKEGFDSCDQIWLNLVPVLFEGVAVVSNLGVNVGWWNFHERHISKRNDGSYWVGAQPLHSLHLSHWSPKNPDICSCHYPEIKGSQEWIELAGQYADLCKNYGFIASLGMPYDFSKFDDGKPVETWMRRHYKEFAGAKCPLDDSPFASSSYFAKLIEPKGLESRWSRKIKQRVFSILKRC